MILPILLSGALASVVTYAGVAAFRRWAESRRILDVPNERSSHVRPTPRGGGLVIAAATVAMGFAGWALPGGPEALGSFLAYAAAATVITAMSWLDDLRSIPSWLRLLAHFNAAVIVVCGLGYWASLPIPFAGSVHLGWAGLLLTLFWIVGLTNAYNFMDGIDGIAAGQAVVAGLSWALLGWGGDSLASGLGLLAAAASMGFLAHNWPPARIFMGDAGSAFLGFTFAVLPLMARPAGSAEPAGAALLIAILLLWPFIFDTTLTLIRRLIARENVFQAHRSHLYQRLAAAGWSHARVTLIYVGLAVCGSVVARLWTSGAISLEIAALVCLPVLAAALWTLVAAVERRSGRGTP